MIVILICIIIIHSVCIVKASDENKHIFTTLNRNGIIYHCVHLYHHMFAFSTMRRSDGPVQFHKGRFCYVQLTRHLYSASIHNRHTCRLLREWMVNLNVGEDIEPYILAHGSLSEFWGDPILHSINRIDTMYFIHVSRSLCRYRFDGSLLITHGKLTELSTHGYKDE